MARFLRRAICVTALMFVIGLTSIATQRDATAHGTLDQTLQGNPDCPSSTFRGYEGVGTSQQQEVVPQLPYLLAFDVCVLGGVEPYNVEINVRSGDIANPGDVLASASAPAVASFAGWIHLDLPSPLAVTPGNKIILEMFSAEPYSWFSTCRSVIGLCTSVDPDLYPAGDTNSQYATDYAFRSYGVIGETTSPTPSPISRQFGDLNCDSTVNDDDTLLPLAFTGGVSTQVPQGCPVIGSQLQFGNTTVTWGNIDCQNGTTPVDTLDLLRFLQGLVILNEPPGCPLPSDTS